MTTPKIEAVGHLHSDGSYCGEKPLNPPEWPVNVYPQQTVDALLAEVERLTLTCGQLQDAARLTIARAERAESQAEANRRDADGRNA